MRASCIAFFPFISDFLRFIRIRSKTFHSTVFTATSKMMICGDTLMACNGAVSCKRGIYYNLSEGLINACVCCAILAERGLLDSPTYLLPHSQAISGVYAVRLFANGQFEGHALHITPSQHWSFSRLNVKMSLRVLGCSQITKIGSLLTSTKHETVKVKLRYFENGASF